MKKFFLIFIIIFSLIGFVGCTQKDDTKSQFIKAFDIDIEEKDIELKEEFNDYGGFPYEGMALYKITRYPCTILYTIVSFCVYDAENKIAYLITMDS